MEEGRGVCEFPGWLLRYLCLRRTARRSHCRYAIEICSRDVSGNLRSDSSFRDFYRDFQEIAETALDPRVRARGKEMGGKLEEEVHIGGQIDCSFIPHRLKDELQISLEGSRFVTCDQILSYPRAPISFIRMR